MNNHTEYRGHSYQPPVQVTSGADDPSASQLSRHVDPSLPTPQLTAQSPKRVAWIRPSELGNFTGPLIGRGIDLQAELIRRARRTPAKATRAARRGIAQSPNTERTAPLEEGIGL